MKILVSFLRSGKQSFNTVAHVFSFGFCAFVCIHSVQAQKGAAGLPFVRNFSPIEYKAGIQNWAIVEDKRRVVYIANNYGLLEYDGQEWQTYRVKNATKIRSLAIGQNGHIYVGCQGDFGYFFPDELGKIGYTSLADSLAPAIRNFDETWNVFVDEDKVYFCTFKRIFIYSNGQIRSVESENPLDLSFYVNRKLFVHQKEIGLSILQDNKIQPIPKGNFFAYTNISSIVPLNKDNLLISTFQNGIYTLNENVLKPWKPSLQESLKDAIVNCMLLLRNGNLAVGTQNNGLFIYSSEGELLINLTKGKGLENRTILSFHEDDAGNLWVGQNNGLSYVELGSPFTHINEENGLPGTGYTAYLDKTLLYLGTNNGLYVRETTKPLDRGTLIEGSSGQVYHIGKYAGDLLFGHHSGAFRVDGRRAVRLSSEPGAWIFTQMPSTQSTQIIGGTYNGLVSYTKRNNQWTSGKKLKGFNESSRIMELGNNGELWVTHGYKGAYQLSLTDSDSVKVNYFGIEKGFPSTNLINVFSIRNELVFTTEKGIYRYNRKENSFQKDSLFSHLLGIDAQLWVMKEDAHGNIYYIGKDQSGVLKYNAVGEYVKQENTFNRIRGFLNDDLENMHVLASNEVLIGSKEGFIHYAPERDIRKPNTFFTLLRKVSIVKKERDSVLFFGNYLVNGKWVDQQNVKQRVELPFSENAINFQLSATTYEGNDVHFQFYLENFEKGWSEWTPVSKKEYTNLREGRYVFHARARDAYGTLSEPIQFTFYIHPPWYRSLWAILVYILISVASLLALFYAIDRRYRRAQRVLKLKQQKELIHKENEIVKISTQSQEEISRLQTEKLESELVHLNKELGTSTFHLLNKNEFISSIKTELTSIVKKGHHPEVQKELNKIVREIETNISEDADWEQFQIHFDRVHGDFSKRFKTAHPALSPQEIKLSAYLRMNLTTKEIAQLLHISIRGVEISRYRLRKKLKLDRSSNLQEYILSW